MMQQRGLKQLPFGQLGEWTRHHAQLVEIACLNNLAIHKDQDPVT